VILPFMEVLGASINITGSITPNRNVEAYNTSFTITNTLGNITNIYVNGVPTSFVPVPNGYNVTVGYVPASSPPIPIIVTFAVPSGTTFSEYSSDW